MEIVTFAENLSRKEWINKELMASLTTEVFQNMDVKKQEFEVQLLVNGINVPLKWFNSIMTKFEEHINEEAKELFKNYIEDIDLEVQKFDDIIRDIKEDMTNKFNKYVDERNI